MPDATKPISASRPVTEPAFVPSRSLSRLHNPFARTPFSGYIVAIASTLAAAGIRAALTPLIGKEAAPLLMFVPAIVVTAWVGGAIPGIVSVFLSTVIATYFFLPPQHSFRIHDPATAWSLLLFLLVGFGISVMGEMQNRARLARQQSQDLLTTTLRSIGDGVIATDEQGRITFMNAVAQRLTGWTEQDACEQPIEAVFRIVNETNRTAIGNPVQRVIAERASVNLTNHTVLISKDGTEYPIDDSGAPIQDPNGNLFGAVLVFHDISDRRQTERAQRFLTEASTVFASSLDYEETLRQVTNLAVPHIADWCAVDMKEEDGSIRLLAVAHVDPAKVIWAYELRKRYPPDPASPRGLPEVLRTGRSELYPDIPEEMLVAGARDAEHLRVIREIGFRSAMVVPIVARGRVLGAITFVATQESGRSYGAKDRELAEGLAARAALAIDNALLYRDAQTELEERQRAVDALAHHQAEIEELNIRLQRSMRETHHRVKNNLQVIAALVNMLEMDAENTVPVSELTRLSQHIKALASIHDLLTHQAQDEAEASAISVRDMMQKLLPIVQGVNNGREISFTAEDLRLPVRQSTAFAVLVNELISNALKHGGGTVHLDFRTEGDMAWLSVEDNGPGFPPYFDPASAANTGLDLIESLANMDLRGGVRYENRPDGGARVVIEFPIPSLTGE